MSVRRLSFYITDADVIIRSDHLPLKKFLNKQMMNSKVNNWAVELEQLQLHLEWIPGSWNLLADSLSHLLDMVPNAQQPKEPSDQEFSSYCFEELELAKLLGKVSIETIELKPGSSDDPECSQKSWRLFEEEGVVGNYENKGDNRQSQAINSEFTEHSQNSWAEAEIGTFKFKFEEKLTKKQTLLSSSEFGEHYQDSRKSPCVKITKHEDLKEITLPLKLKAITTATKE